MDESIITAYTNDNCKVMFIFRWLIIKYLAEGSLQKKV